ncbi:hypothetical protein D3C81_1824740 [compost metagenome]
MQLLCFLHDEREPFRSCQRPRIGGFHHNNIFVITLCQVAEILLQISQSTVPPRIKGQADDIILYAVLLEAVKKPAAGVIVSAPVNVDHNRQLRRDLPGSGNPRLHQFSEPGPLLLRIILPVYPALFPQEARCDLVSDLHHIRQRSLIL